MRILIVEHEPLIALSLAAELRGAGHEVLGPSNDGDEAVCLACDHSADLALVDAGLSGSMSGLELARALQTECHVPVLLLTTQPANLRASSDAALGLIALPFDPAELPETVHAADIVIHGGRPPKSNLPHSLRLF